MAFYLYPYHLILFSSLVIVAVLSFRVWQYKAQTGYRLILTTFFFIIIWIIAQALELAVNDLEGKIFWRNIAYISVFGAPAVYFKLVMQYTHHTRWYRSRLCNAVLILVPLVFHILLWTNGSHELIRQDVHIDVSGFFPVLGKTFSVLFWPFVPYNFLVTFLTFGFLLQSMLHKSIQEKKQLLMLSVGLLLPVITTALTFFDTHPINFDLTPAVFSISGLLISFAVFRYSLFNVLPVAYSRIFQDLQQGIIIFNADDRVADMNRAASEMLDLDIQQSISKTWHELFAREGALEILYDRKEENQQSGFLQTEFLTSRSGCERYFDISLRRISDRREKLIGWILTAYDITERKRSEEQANYIALHDILTGLPNRRAFFRLAEEQIAYMEQHEEGFGLVYIDIDNFKSINDTWGHQGGDFILKETARLLMRVVRQTDIAARIGGDEFVLLLPGLSCNEHLLSVTDKIFSAAKRGVVLNEQSISLGMSMGLCLYPRDGKMLEELLTASDAAMYQAKKSGKNRCSF